LFRPLQLELTCKYINTFNSEHASKWIHATEPKYYRSLLSRLGYHKPKLDFMCKVSTITYGLFVVYLTTLFQYLRLYSVDFYSFLIRLPCSSEAGETRVRKMASEFCRRACRVLLYFITLKIHRPRLGLNPRTLGPVASTLTTRPPRATLTKALPVVPTTLRFGNQIWIRDYIHRLCQHPAMTC
jgi:hypothetical protein